MAEGSFRRFTGSVERFAKVSALFVEALRVAVAEAAQNPELASTPAFRAWQSKALPLLQQKNASIQAAFARFTEGEVRPIVALAEDKRSLAKDLDGFPLTFAGQERAGDS